MKEKSKIYKDILFIDDKDDNNSIVADLEDEENSQSESDDNFFGKYFSSGKEYIELVTSFGDACEKIFKKSTKYNLVIFDMNLNKGVYDIKSKYNEIKEYFENNHIAFEKFYNDYNDKKKTFIYIKENQEKVEFDFEKYSGIFLYLLLQAKGYPADRMMILTGNKEEDQSENVNAIFPMLDLKKITKYKAQEGAEEKDKMDLDKYFSQDKNSYYRIRRLVFQACDYWKKRLDKTNIIDEKTKVSLFEKLYGDNNGIPFNKLYKLEGEKAITADSFIEMLDDIKRLFPVLPDEPKKVYYQAAKNLCMFHEESAKISEVKNNYSDVFKYHQTARFFRNWSSHNLFSKLELDYEAFALLFCIGLRTYFDENQLDPNRKLSATEEAYEKCYYNFSRSTIDPNSEYGKKVMNYQKQYEKHIKLGDILDSHYNKKTDNLDLTYKTKYLIDIIRICGEKSIVQLDTNAIFYPLIFDGIELTIPDLNGMVFNQGKSIAFTITPKTANFQSNIDIILNKNNDIYGLFAGEAYRMICELPEQK